MWEKGFLICDESESSLRGVIRKEELLYFLEWLCGIMVIFWVF